MSVNQPSRFPPSLKSESAPLAGRIKFYRAANADLIRQIRCGLIYIMAMWSGPARKAYPAFITAVLDADPGQVLEVIVVDSDGVSEEWRVFPEIDCIIGGYGEVVAVHNGKIHVTSASGYAPERYLPIAKSLVLACQQLCSR